MKANELEQTLLGAILQYGELIDDVIGIVQPEAFKDGKNRMVFDAMVQLSVKLVTPDLATVSNKLQEIGVYTQDIGLYLFELNAMYCQPQNVKEYALKIVERHAITHAIMRAGQMSMTEEKDPFVILNEIYSAADEVNEILNPNLISDSISTDIAHAEMIRIAKIKKGQALGIPTGMEELTQATSGWQNTDLTIVAARPGMGKTAFMMTCALAAAKHHPIAVASLEMSKEQLMQRVISATCQIEFQKLRKNELNHQEMNHIAGKIESMPKFYINDNAYQSIATIAAWAKRMVKRKGCKMLFIDYLQLIDGGKTKVSRNDEIGAISRGLKLIAKDLNIPVMCLSQLSREVEKRADKRPMLSDLRESGSIEQDADNVIFLYRPEYYGIEQDATGQSTKGAAEVIIAKQRNGPLETINCKFIGKYTKYEGNNGDEYHAKPDDKPVNLPYKDDDDDSLPF